MPGSGGGFRHGQSNHFKTVHLWDASTRDVPPPRKFEEGRAGHSSDFTPLASIPGAARLCSWAGAPHGSPGQRDPGCAPPPPLSACLLDWGCPSSSLPPSPPGDHSFQSHPLNSCHARGATLGRLGVLPSWGSLPSRKVAESNFAAISGFMETLGDTVQVPGGGEQ